MGKASRYSYSALVSAGCVLAIRFANLFWQKPWPYPIPVIPLIALFGANAIVAIARSVGRVHPTDLGVASSLQTVRIVMPPRTWELIRVTRTAVYL